MSRLNWQGYACLSKHMKILFKWSFNDEAYFIYTISCLNLITNFLNPYSMYTFFGQQYTVVSTYTGIILFKMWDSAARSTCKISFKDQTVEGKTNG